MFEVGANIVIHFWGTNQKSGQYKIKSIHTAVKMP